MAKAGLLFVGTDDGLVLFSNPNNIGRWLRIGQPFRGQGVRAVWPLADNPLVVFAAVQGMGLQRSDDGGQRWAPALDEDVGAIAASRMSPGLLYLSTLAGALYRSGDAGGSWSPCAAGGWPPAEDMRLIVAHADPQTIYVGSGAGRIWASRDGGASWASFGEPLPAPLGGLAESQAEPGALYAVAGGALYRGAAGAPWQALPIDRPATGPVVVLAGRPPALLLAGEGGIARSDDDGATWASAPAELEWGGRVTTLVPATYHIDTVFAGSAAGRLATSADRGRSWQAIRQDLPPIASIAAARLT